MLAFVRDIPRRCWNFTAIVWCSFANVWIAQGGGDGDAAWQPKLIAKRTKTSDTQPA